MPIVRAISILKKRLSCYIFSNKYQIILKGNFCPQSKLLLPFRGDGREVNVKCFSNMIANM